jgi:hypothetical protein
MNPAQVELKSERVQAPTSDGGGGFDVDGGHILDAAAQVAFLFICYDVYGAQRRVTWIL